MYKSFAIITIVAVYILILVGGIVRATGSGMGCPDWPKCFGTWIPPTSVEQLPGNYQEVFGEKLKGEVEFSAVKTWTEYINRLLGVLIGFFIFITLVLSFKEYRGRGTGVIKYSLIAFFLVGAQGFLGSIVVSTELHPGLVSVHMLVAIVIVLCLIYALFLAYRNDSKVVMAENRSLRFLALILLILSVGQLVLGTQIREMVDKLSFGHQPRSEWVDSLLGGQFFIHIFLGIVLLGVHVVFYRGGRKVLSSWGLGILKTLLAVVILEFIFGAILGVFNIPAFAQPIHLTFATLIIGLQFALFLVFGKSKVSLN
ncbi:COX15/CtaA family protein [Arcticibacterium luteifluviistationis]|uniref:Heme A synthase n=1 Tax=Arcticibacterium luteifluviistationis TaxID=1784714 RepID=A0A2Z4GGY7_9BACT|nr:COX15/CtaA family protein [Arcticibacterium luteifluviistationis]AWW00064.1 heme A synthase [Arcticibacterium luteifluviistationis]